MIQGVICLRKFLNYYILQEYPIVIKVRFTIRNIIMIRIQLRLRIHGER